MKYLILLMLLTSACTYDPDLFDEKISEESFDATEEVVPDVGDKVEEPTETTEEDPLKPRITERDVRLKFDFNLLTADNCDFYVDSYRLDVAEFSDDLEDLNDDLDKKEGDADRLFEELNSLEQSDSLWERTKKDYDTVQGSIDNFKTRIKEGERLFEDMKYTLDEMKKECIILKKRKP